MSSQMKAIVIHAARDLRIEDRPEELPGPGQVQVRLAFGGICGSDLHYFNHGGFGTVHLREPMILGHEVSGHITELGTGVSGLSVDQLVAVSPSRPCGSCRFCRAAQFNRCLEMQFMVQPCPFRTFREPSGRCWSRMLEVVGAPDERVGFIVRVADFVATPIVIFVRFPADINLGLDLRSERSEKHAQIIGECAFEDLGFLESSSNILCFGKEAAAGVMCDFKQLEALRASKSCQESMCPVVDCQPHSAISHSCHLSGANPKASTWSGLWTRIALCHPCAKRPRPPQGAQRRHQPRTGLPSKKLSKCTSV